nr:hypothetical protein [Tanacetum cinerariifolium]
MQDNAKESCMVSFRLMHSYLTALSNNHSKGTCIKGGFEQAFVALFDQGIQAFTSSMLLNLDQLEKQLDKEEFQETGSTDAFRALMTQFQTFINFQYYFNDFDDTVICKFFQAHTRTEIRQLCDTLIQHMESLRESILERAKHKREKDRRVIDRMMQSKKRKDHSSTTLDDDINSVNDKEPMAEVNLSVEQNILANEQQHSEQSASVYDTYLLEKNEKLNKENEHLKHTYKDLSDSIKKTSVQTKDHADSLIVQLNCKTDENVDLKAQIQEKVFANAALKNELRKSKGNSVDTKFAKPSILGKPNLQPPRNQSVVRQPTAFKYERPNFSKLQFASQVDVNNVLSKTVTPHYFPKVRESAPAKPHHVNAPSTFRNSKKESYDSNDMAHNYYLEEAKKKTPDQKRNLKPRKMPSAKTYHTLMLVHQNLGAIIKHLEIGLHLRVVRKS